MAKLEIVISNLVAAIGSRSELHGDAFIYCDAMDMACPLCEMTVPRATEHRCSKPAVASETRKTPRKRKAIR